MAGASVESCQFLVLRSPGGRFWSVVDVRKRLHRMRGRSHRCIHMSKVLCTLMLWTIFFLEFWTLPSKTTPRPHGKGGKTSGRCTLRACLAGASAPTRPDVPTRSCRRLPVTAGLTTRPVCPQAPPGIAPPTHRTYIGFRIQ